MHRSQVCPRPGLALSLLLLPQIIPQVAPVGADQGNPCRCRTVGDQSLWWLAGQGSSLPTAHMCASRFHTVTPGTIELHLPSFVGGMANSAPQLLCLFLWGEVRLGTGGAWAQRASVACEWSSSLVWLRGSRATCSVFASMSVECVPASHLSRVPPSQGSAGWLCSWLGGITPESSLEPSAVSSAPPAVQRKGPTDPLSCSVSASCFKHLALWHTLYVRPCVLGFYWARVPRVWAFSKAENKVQVFGDPGMTSFFWPLSCPYLISSDIHRADTLLPSFCST